jgi:hypothetical protein
MTFETAFFAAEVAVEEAYIQFHFTQGLKTIKKVFEGMKKSSIITIGRVNRLFSLINEKNNFL